MSTDNESTIYNSIDAQREKFRKYLEKTGVLDALTKGLTMLFLEPNKPDRAIDFLIQNMTDCIPSDTETGEKPVDQLDDQNVRDTLLKAQEKIAALELELDELKKNFSLHDDLTYVCDMDKKDVDREFVELQQQQKPDQPIEQKQLESIQEENQDNKIEEIEKDGTNTVQEGESGPQEELAEEIIEIINENGDEEREIVEEEIPIDGN